MKKKIITTLFLSFLLYSNGVIAGGGEPEYEIPKQIAKEEQSFLDLMREFQKRKKELWINSLSGSLQLGILPFNLLSNRLELNKFINNLAQSNFKDFSTCNAYKIGEDSLISPASCVVLDLFRIQRAQMLETREKYVLVAFNTMIDAEDKAITTAIPISMIKIHPDLFKNYLNNNEIEQAGDNNLMILKTLYNLSGESFHLPDQDQFIENDLHLLKTEKFTIDINYVEVSIDLDSKNYFTYFAVESQESFRGEDPINNFSSTGLVDIRKTNHLVLYAITTGRSKSNNDIAIKISSYTNWILSSLTNLDSGWQTLLKLN